jgi:hypothetical protein
MKAMLIIATLLLGTMAQAKTFCIISEVNSLGVERSINITDIEKEEFLLVERNQSNFSIRRDFTNASRTTLPDILALEGSLIIRVSFYNVADKSNLILGVGTFTPTNRNKTVDIDVSIIGPHQKGIITNLDVRSKNISVSCTPI